MSVYSSSFQSLLACKVIKMSVGSFRSRVVHVNYTDIYKLILNCLSQTASEAEFED